ncbi:MAG: DUF1987 domain-containing protein [Campylobacterota bacterium]|nr:DUF1987 domain-containing protein [Campylobacterota bacterium]
MENIDIEMTDNSPKVIMDFEKGFIELEGKSYPENTFEFYEPLVKSIEKYFESNELETTNINIKLTYFNSATTQVLFDLLDAIQDGKSNTVILNWYYDSNNENGLDDYEDYSDEFEDLDIQAISY